MFTFFRLILVNSGNLVLFYVGWEGIGLFSFLLIGFWYDRPQAIKASLKAIFYNRIGDIAFLIGRSLLFKARSTYDFPIIERLYPLLYKYKKDITVLTLISFIFLVSAIAKSSQLRLHLWLPDAREGPTPVSALIHAATRVTAGLYLRLRRNYRFTSNHEILTVIRVIGALTSLFGSLTALFQFDIKRIIAFSTCSQLGYRRTAIGLNQFEAAFNHLIMHAYFKALLFLVAGIIIHQLNNEQDIQRRGGLLTRYPFVYRVFLLANLSLCALISTSGYYSKDLIIERAYVKATINRSIIYERLNLAAIVTRLYTARRLYYVFYRKTNLWVFNFQLRHTHSLSINQIVVRIRLVIPSFTCGYFLSEIRNPINGFFNDIKITNQLAESQDLIFLEKQNDVEYRTSKIKKNIWKQYFSVFRILYIVYYFKRERYFFYFKKSSNKIREFLTEKRRFDVILNYISVKTFKEARNTCFIAVDKRVIETVTVRGSTWLIKKMYEKYIFNGDNPFKLLRITRLITFVIRQLV